MGGSGPAHTADPALAHRGLWQCWEQAGLCSELERFKHGNVKALGCCHPPTAPTATPEVPTPASRTEPRRNMQSPGGQAGAPCTGGHAQHWRHRRGRTGTCTSLLLRVTPDLLQTPPTWEPCVPCPPQSLQGAGSSTPGTWVLPSPVTLWHQDLVLSLFCTGDLLLPRDCQGILLTPNSSD